MHLCLLHGLGDSCPSPTLRIPSSCVMEASRLLPLSPHPLLRKCTCSFKLSPACLVPTPWVSPDLRGDSSSAANVARRSYCIIETEHLKEKRLRESEVDPCVTALNLVLPVVLMRGPLSSSPGQRDCCQQRSELETTLLTASWMQPPWPRGRSCPRVMRFPSPYFCPPPLNFPPPCSAFGEYTN